MSDPSAFSSDHIYEIRGLIKSYGGGPVVDIPELELRRGEIFCVLGPSGAGKSTLLRILGFLELPTSGYVAYRGMRFDRTHPMPLKVRREISMVFQRPLLLTRSVYANVRFGLALRGQRDNAAEIGEALEQVGLRELARQRARTLSGGEAQRVALARAMVLNPTVLLLDEATANLDPYNVGLMEQNIRAINQTRGATVVMVTHNVFQARRLATRVGLMLEGKLVEVKDADEFFDSPSDPRTAAFVRGEMVY